jgi:hypothetical protein
MKQTITTYATIVRTKCRFKTLIPTSPSDRRPNTSSCALAETGPGNEMVSITIESFDNVCRL